MRKITLSILAVTWSICAVAQTLDRSVRPNPGPAPEVQLGDPATFTLPNGLKVFVVENHKLPVVSYSIQLDIKPALEGDMAGYREMMSELLVSGTRTRNKQKLNEEIDFVGARISASDGGLYGSSLKKHQATLLALLSDIAMNADFKQEELDKIRKRSLSALEIGRNEPETMLKNATAAINYGQEHPYGTIATEESVNNITLEKCRGYYETYFRPNVAYMAIVGDITVAEARELTEKYFGSWQKADVPVARYNTPVPPERTRVAFVPRDAAVQSVFNVSYPIDLKPGSPDVIKARVANSILGGGSQGRLFLNLREQHGWTYGSYSDLEADELAGSFTAFANCRNGVTDSAIREILAEMNRVKDEPVSEETVQNTIAYLSGGFAIGLQDPSRIAQYAINIERYNMPKDYYRNYLKNLAAVTAADIQQIAQRYITPGKANVIVVGNRHEVADKLTDFDADGNISFYDHYGRPVNIKAAAVVPAGITANDILKQYANAIGGEKALRSIRDIKTESEGDIQGIKIGITEIKKTPGKMKTMVSQMGMVVQKKVLNGDKSFQEAGGQKIDMNEEDIADSRESADLLSPLFPEKYGITRTIKGMDQINGADAYMLEAVNSQGTVVTEYYEASTGLLVKKVSNVETPQGPVSVSVEYSDYREVPGTNGYRLPYITRIPIGPGMMLETEVKTVEVNKNIPDSEFQ